jgi:hypothetical protein
MKLSEARSELPICNITFALTVRAIAISFRELALLVFAR